MPFNISSKTGPGYTQRKKKTETQNDTETKEATEDTISINGHPGLAASDNGEKIVAH